MSGHSTWNLLKPYTCGDSFATEVHQACVSGYILALDEVIKEIEVLGQGAVSVDLYLKIIKSRAEARQTLSALKDINEA